MSSVMRPGFLRGKPNFFGGYHKQWEALRGTSPCAHQAPECQTVARSAFVHSGCLQRVAGSMLYFRRRV